MGRCLHVPDRLGLAVVVADQAGRDRADRGLMIENTIIECVAPDGSRPRVHCQRWAPAAAPSVQGPFPEACRSGTSAYCVPPRLSWYGQDEVGRMPTDAEGGCRSSSGTTRRPGDGAEEQSFEYAVPISPLPRLHQQRVAVLDYLIELDGVEVVDPDVRLLGRQGVAIGFAGATPVYARPIPDHPLGQRRQRQDLRKGSSLRCCVPPISVVFTEPSWNDSAEEVIDMACQTHREAPDYANPFVCPSPERQGSDADVITDQKRHKASPWAARDNIPFAAALR